MKHMTLFLLLIFTVNSSSFAQTTWQTDGVPVCTATNAQQNPVIVPDMKGGGIIIWQDYRSGNYDIYAQRVDSTGNACWQSNGAALTASAEHELEPKTVSDMRGGAIMVFNRGNYNVWAQRVDSAGNACWGANGVAICDNDSLQGSYRLCSDSVGGAIITWMNADTFATGLADWDVYAQRVDSAGNILWGINGKMVAGGINNQGLKGVVSDDMGGAIVFWDSTSSFNCRAYADRIGPNGNLLWASPASVCTLLSYERFLWCVSTDNRGGGIVVWKEKRVGSFDIYAQRVDSSGNVLWQLNGVPVCTATLGQEEPVVNADGCGGGVITWHDYRNSYADIYAQRVDSMGSTLWQQNGVAVCSYDSTQAWPCIISTDTGKTVISWFDRRSGDYNIYAQALGGDGSLAWGTSGVAICAAANDQLNSLYNRQEQIITADKNGGVIIVWHDYRNGNYDIYAQKLRGLISGVAGEPDGRSLICQTWLKVYPNPFRHYANINGMFMNAEIKVYDITGRLVERTKGPVVGKKLGAGIYFISAENYKTVKAIKLK